MTRQQVTEKLQGVKALADRGVGGEKETAQRLYEKLKEKYGISDGEEQQAAGSGAGIEVDLFRAATLAKQIQDEQEECSCCPYQTGQQECEECGTYENIRKLCAEFEVMTRHYRDGGGRG